MFNVINSTTGLNIPVINKRKPVPTLEQYKFNTGQPLTDTVTFTSKIKKQDRIDYALKHDFEKKYGIKPEAANSTMIDAHRAGLDPRNATHVKIKAVKLGLNPETATEKSVAEEPHRRLYEIEAKLLNISTEGKELEDIARAVREKQLQIHREVVEEVLGKAGIPVPESYKPLHYTDFSSVLKTDATLAEQFSLLSDALRPDNERLNPIAKLMLDESDIADNAQQAANKMQAVFNESPMTDDRRADLHRQMEINEALEIIMIQLFTAKSVGFEDALPDLAKVQSLNEKSRQLRSNAFKMKRDKFDKALKALKP